MRNLIGKKWLWYQVVPVVAGIVLLKYILHTQGLEIFELSTLFTAVISANVFLLSFLLAGVLSDFKESERLPGEMTVLLDAMVDDIVALKESKKPASADDAITYIASFVQSLKQWFHKEERTANMLERVRGFNRFFLAFESLLPPNYIVRLKQEQTALRRLILRVDTIRDTSFVVSGYQIAMLNSIFLIIGIICIRLDSIASALYFTGIISFLFLYMLALIRDLDNPFAFYETGTAENVPLKLLDDLEERLEGLKK